MEGLAYPAGRGYSEASRGAPLSTVPGVRAGLYSNVLSSTRWHHHGAAPGCSTMVHPICTVLHHTKVWTNAPEYASSATSIQGAECGEETPGFPDSLRTLASGDLSGPDYGSTPGPKFCAHWLRGSGASGSRETARKLKSSYIVQYSFQGCRV